LAICSTFAVACGQLSFEVASVKPAGPETRSFALWTYPGGRVVAQNQTLLDLVREAYGVEEFQVSGGPAWARQILYNIDARPPADSQSSHSSPSNNKMPMNSEQRQMLQTLLAERFQLQVHRETRQGPVYGLVKSNKPLKLSPAKDPNEYPWAGSPEGGAMGGTGLAGTNISMPQLAERLSGYLGRPVLDETRIEGAFDFVAAHPADNTNPDVGASVIRAIEELGLKLESGKGPTETIVIDRAEKPAAN
jgi:uncharacterized protein (TIGR03435 family)